MCLIFRRTNELKSEIDIPDDVIMKFKQFWSDFKDTPLKGRKVIDSQIYTKGYYYINLYFFCGCSIAECIGY